MSGKNKNKGKIETLQFETVEKAADYAMNCSDIYRMRCFVICMITVENCFFVSDTDKVDDRHEKIVQIWEKGIKMDTEQLFYVSFGIHMINMYINSPVCVNNSFDTFVRGTSNNGTVTVFTESNNQENTFPVSCIKLYLKELNEMPADLLLTLADRCIVEKNYSIHALKTTVLQLKTLPARKWNISELSAFITEIRLNGYDCDNLLNTGMALPYKSFKK